MLQFPTKEDSPQLSHRFYDQNARHDRGVRVMALEKNVIKSDVFDPNRLLIPNDLHHPIDQQHRISVRQNTLNPANIEHRVPLNQALAGVGFVLLKQLACELMIQLMAGFVRDQATSDRTADEIKITDQVQRFVPRAL